MKNKSYQNVKSHASKYKNQLHREIQMFKNSYYRIRLNGCRNNSKDTCKLINDITRKKRKDSLIVFGSIFSNSSDVSNKLSNSFLIVVYNLNVVQWKPATLESLPYRNNFKTVHSVKSMYITPVTVEELINVIKSL